LREVDGSYGKALHIIAGVMAVSVLLPILVSPPKVHDVEPDDPCDATTVAI
ncbi:MAG: hypothetical protein QOF78_2342, partial [Phycisphaerales bacterium]|nr:hypothetical protein [Phycisphaerales bacterium]